MQTPAIILYLVYRAKVVPGFKPCVDRLRLPRGMHAQVGTMGAKVPFSVYLAWYQQSLALQWYGRYMDHTDGSARWYLSCAALMAYFAMVAQDAKQGANKAVGGVALPSKAAHLVWSSWERRDPAGLHAFLNTHLGQAAEAIGLCPDRIDSPAPRAMGNAWRLANMHELVRASTVQKAAPATPAMPLVFDADRRTGIASGWVFARNGFTGGFVQEPPKSGFYTARDLPGWASWAPRGEAELSWVFAGLYPDAPTPSEAFERYAAQHEARPAEPDQAPSAALA